MPHRARVANWYLSLGLRQKVVFGVAIVVALFLGSLWGTVLIASLPREGDEKSALTSQTALSTGPPKIDVRIKSARWEGAKAVVEGTWRGDLSSVRCDLFEDRDGGRVTDWWNRGVAARMSWSQHTFEQDFVRAKGRKIEDPIDPAIGYSVVCLGMFSGEVAKSVPASVAGRPSG